MNGECPICGAVLQHKSYQDGIFGGCYTVEEHYDCPNGHYKSGHSYGQHHTKIGDREWTWHWNSEADEIAVIHAEIEAAELEANEVRRKP